MTKWQEVRLGDVCKFQNGKKRPKEPGKYPVFGGNGILDYTNQFNSNVGVIVGRVGAYCGSVFLSKEKCWVSDNAILGINTSDTDIIYLYYLLKSLNLNAKHIGSGQPLITQDILNNIKIFLPPLDVQKKIAGVLGALDDKIELNNRINNNLEQQAQALFKSWFVDKTNPNRKNIKVEEFFNISIGKTPPRKEPEWFSKNPDDIIWVSISDMGNCGTFISNSSEYLTKKAVSKFNIKIVPDNTVLLSFKLTVGRVAITDGNMTTNEAIAHFITGKKEINEYLYCYLKNFNFQTMGSTSSIATAVNSKIIKAMPIVMPTEKELIDFHTVTYPMFLQIKANQQENTRLSALRDTLLPKLMSGEVDVSKVDISALTSTDKLSFRK